MLKHLVTLVFFFSTIASAVDFTSQCKKFADPTLTGGYCIHTPTGEASRDIVYYLHGAQLNEKTWQEDWYYTAQIRKYWKEIGAKFPTVISISFGPFWVLAEENSGPFSGLLDKFTKQVMPMLEQEAGGLKGRRILMGESMGGINSIQLTFKTNLFDKVAILCAPMAEISGFSSKEEIEKFMKNSSAWQYYKDAKENPIPKLVGDLLEGQKLIFPTAEEWAKSDPLVLAKNANHLSSPIYLAVGFHDEFVAYEGNEKFAAILKAKGFNLEWRPQWGGHCAMDIPSLAAFLVK